MKATLVLTILTAVVVAFAAANWNVFTQPTELNLLATTVSAPLGMILLGAIVVLLVVLAATLAWGHASMLMASRTHARESERLRQIAEDAEASRLAQLRSWLEAELQAQAARADDSSAQLMQRLDALEQALHEQQEQGENSLAAYIGQLEDRLDPQTGGMPSRVRPELDRPA